MVSVTRVKLPDDWRADLAACVSLPLAERVVLSIEWALGEYVTFRALQAKREAREGEVDRAALVRDAKTLLRRLKRRECERELQRLLEDRVQRWGSGRRRRGRPRNEPARTLAVRIVSALRDAGVRITPIRRNSELMRVLSLAREWADVLDGKQRLERDDLYVYASNACDRVVNVPADGAGRKEYWEG
jgi:hypothetical protein